MTCSCMNGVPHGIVSEEKRQWVTAGEALAALSGQFQLHQGEGAGGAAGRAKLGRWGEGGGEAGGPIPASPMFPP